MMFNNCDELLTTMEECLKDGRSIDLRTSNITDRYVLEKLRYSDCDANLLDMLLDLVISGRCYPQRFYSIFNVKADKFTCILKMHCDATEKPRFDVRELYRNEIKMLSQQTMFERYGVAHNWQKGAMRDKLEEKWLRTYGSKSPLASKEIQDKIAETNLALYGVDRPFKSPEIQAKVVDTNIKRYGVHTTFLEPNTQAKIKETNLALYGVDKPFKSPEIQAKVKKSLMETYGVETPFKSPEIQAKIKETNLALYGVDHPFKSPVIQAKAKDTSLKNNERLQKVFELSSKGESQRESLLQHLFESYKQTQISVYTKRFKLRNFFKSQEEYRMSKILDEMGISYIRNSKSYHGLRNRDGNLVEFDFLIEVNPKYRVVIEVNGVAFHSSNKAIWEEPKPKDYHLERRLLCQRNGIKLLAFMCFDINNPDRRAWIKDCIQNAIDNPWDDDKLEAMRKCDKSQYELTRYFYKGYEYWDYGRFIQ